jgi:hypothetical protein
LAGMHAMRPTHNKQIFNRDRCEFHTLQFRCANSI